MGNQETNSEGLEYQDDLKNFDLLVSEKDGDDLFKRGYRTISGNIDVWNYIKKLQISIENKITVQRSENDIKKFGRYFSNLIKDMQDILKSHERAVSELELSDNIKHESFRRYYRQEIRNNKLDIKHSILEEKKQTQTFVKFLNKKK